MEPLPIEIVARLMLSGEANGQPEPEQKKARKPKGPSRSMTSPWR